MKTTSAAFFPFIASLLFIIPFHLARAVPVKDAHTEVEIISEVESVKPGSKFWAGARFKMDSGWHIYWKNPGDSGLGTEIEWNLPQSFSAGPVLWPYPKKISQPPWVTYGYDGEVLLMSEIEPPASLATGETLSLAAQVKWLVCEKICIPGKANVILQLPASEEGPKPDERWAEYFSKARERVPLLKTDWGVKITDSKKYLAIHLTSPSSNNGLLKSLYFFPEQSDLIQHAAQQKLVKSRDGYRLEVRKSENLSQVPERIRGVLVTPEGWSGPAPQKALEIDHAIEP